MGHIEHERQAEEVVPLIRCGIITISDTRSEADDTSGAFIRDVLVSGGHVVQHYAVVKDEPTQIVALVGELATAGCQVVITSGGTGIAARDSTFEAVDGLLEKRLPGFGEIFRMLSYHEIGPAAMLSRATAGTVGDMLIFCLPGSTNAVRLGMERLILPELSHLVWEVFRQKAAMR